MIEEWRPVAGYEDRYEVSNLGQVRSLRRGRLLAAPPRSESSPYPSVSLWDGIKGPRVNIHVLVAEAFIGPRPEGQQVCHNDGDPANCEVWNLRYDTPAANAQDAIKHGAKPCGENHHNARVTDDIVREMRYLGSLGVGCNVLAKKFGIDKTNASRILRGETWRHVRPPAWAYYIIEHPEG